MTQFKATSKAEAARKLASIKKEILNQAQKFNSRKTIPLLLCLEDAVNNLEIELCRTRRIDKLSHPEINLALDNFILEWYGIINEMIVHIADRGFYDASTKIELADIQFAAFMGQKHEQDQDLRTVLNELRADGQIGQKVFLRGQPRLFLNKIPGSFCFILRDDVSKHIKQNLDKILRFREMFCQKGLLETMIHRTPEGTKVVFGANGLMLIAYPEDFAVESILEKIGLTPRSIEAHSSVREWNSHFSDVAIETMKSLESGKGQRNLNNLKRELHEIYEAYHSMKDYPETFKELYCVDMETFFGVTFELDCMCYENVHTVGVLNLSKLLTMEKLRKAYGLKNVRKVIQLLYDPTKSMGRRDGLIILGDTVMTNFKRLGITRLALLNKCFNEVYDNNLKGQAFEDACRKMLREKGLKTVPERVEISEPILPLEISVSLWDKQKVKTDIDVIACSNNNVLIIECKEIKWHLPRLREQNQFKKYLIEHLHRVKWISFNLEKFENYVGHGHWLSSAINQDQPVYLFPLLVSNIVVDADEFKKAPIVTFLELKDMVSKEWIVKGASGSGELEMGIGGRVAKLPWFRVAVKDQLHD